MTEKDLLDSLRFVDDDLIEEAGLEQLKEEKQKKVNGKVLFLRTALTAAAGICIFTAGTVMGRKITAKKDQTDGALMMAAYTEREYEKEILALEGRPRFTRNLKIKIHFRFQRSRWEKKRKVRSVKMRHHIMNCQLQVLVGQMYSFIKKKVLVIFSLHLNKIMFPILCRLIRCEKSCRQQQIRSAAWA